MTVQMTISLLFILMTLWTIMHITKFKMIVKTKTMSPFECGYNTLSNKMPLSIQFTLLTFIFLLFDIELAILISLISKMQHMNTQWIETISLFVIMMMISVGFETTKKSFKWK